MTTCVQCGHELGVGRYCVNCGHPVDPGWRTDTAERPSAVASPPVPQEAPPAWTPPPPARFPLFADEMDDDAATPAGSPTAVPGQPVGHAAYAPVGAAPTPHRGRRPWAVGVLVAAVLVLVAAAGVALVSRGDPDDPGGSAAGRDPGSTGSTGGDTSGPSSPEPSDEPLPSPSTGEVAGEATVEVPATAPPGTDVSGQPVDFAAENMLDGRPGTTWRMAGDGTGRTITLTLPQETTLTSVGLVNGYAKTAGTGTKRRDWYHGNRRIERVEWTFDDGTTLTQRLRDSQDVQTVAVDTTTTTVELRLLAVSAPGRGPARRDYTAISDVSLVAG